ncbi:IclR family transcriptional regulator [Leifsonia sp. Leaf336]|uniref:IclR family transcriptional regulator n=1 Tax=Leifsonia sp. Leaf336 TaxID=1736341 RepID=UPI000AF82876|nr:IclR family transcriptional regulator [Leifsonia sp. Leaf336]
MPQSEDDAKLVGADRVLAVLVALADRPEGATLDELSRAVDSSKPTVHRALSALRRAGLATQVARGSYVLGDELIRLAMRNHAERPDSVRVTPILHALVERYGETAHFAVLDGSEVVYRAKMDPPQGAVRLTSEVGGRNPAYRTAVGKLLLSSRLRSEKELSEWLAGRPLEARTPHSITTVPALWKELEATRERGYAVDDQENELGVNCVAVPFESGFAGLDGAISVSALTFRMPLDRLVGEVPNIRRIVESPESPLVAAS